MTEMFSKFCKAVNNAKKVTPFTGRLLAFDPGETLGMCLFNCQGERVSMEACGQLKTWPMHSCVHELTQVFDKVQPTKVVYELYAVYEWKVDDHAWSQVPTLHVIGCIETLCIQRGIPFVSQTAQIAKNFCTDERLQEWGLWQKGQRHARDAIRHAAYNLMFGDKAPTT